MKGIIELGHVVGLDVVAEGVEHVEQYAHLVDMGCDFVQGYYYAPSMDAGGTRRPACRGRRRSGACFAIAAVL